MEAVVYNYSRPWKRAFTANQTGSAFTAKTAVLVRPSGTGVIDLANEGVLCPAFLKMIGVGVGADNDAFSARVWGWMRVIGGGDHPNGGTSANVWIPVRIAEVSFTLSALVGIAGGVVPATERIADTVTIIATGEGVTTANTTNDGNIVRYSPAGDTSPAMVLLPVLGFDLIEFDTDDTTNNPTRNILYSPL